MITERMQAPYNENPETDFSNWINRVGNLRAQFEEGDNGQRRAAQRELSLIYEGEIESYGAARYMAGQALGIAQNVLDRRAGFWIRDLKQERTLASRLDLGFMKLNLPSEKNRVAASRALGIPLPIIFAKEHPLTSLAAGITVAVGTIYHYL